jgi:hypothetical protein
VAVATRQRSGARDMPWHPNRWNHQNRSWWVARGVVEGIAEFANVFSNTPPPPSGPTDKTHP